MSKHNHKYTKEILEEAVKQSTSICGVLRWLDIPCAGGNHHHIKNRIKFYDIDISHFTRQSPNNTNRKRRACHNILIKHKSKLRRENIKALRRALVESGIEYKCAICSNNGIWNNQELVLEIDHIDGDWSNNTRENLRFLCPNCHAQETKSQISNRRPKRRKLQARNRTSSRCETCNKEFYSLTSSKGRYCSWSCASKSRRKVDRPSKDELASLINTISWCAIGKQFGVSDNAVRKWARAYNLL